MSRSIKTLVRTRQRTHGDYAESAGTSQFIKAAMRRSPGFTSLNAAQRESLEMIAFKIARILAGDPGHADHWNDIAGYALLAIERPR